MSHMRNFILVLSVIGSTLHVGYAQKPVALKTLQLFEGREHTSYSLFTTSRNGNEDLREYVDYAINLTLQTEQLAKLNAADEGLFTMQLPAPINLQLDLYQADIFSEGAGITTSRGDRFLPNPNHHYYRGMVHGQPNSLAIVSVFENRIQILYADGNGNHRIQQVNGDQYIAFADKDIRLPKQLECYTDEIEQGTLTATRFAQ